MDSPHILLVDDDTALLQALPHMVALRIHGVQVDTSDSAPEALELIQEHDYDVIVSDIKMPGMDGLDLLEKIQELRHIVPYKRVNCDARYKSNSRPSNCTLKHSSSWWSSGRASFLRAARS
jgi:CheY-like chemotaxis protein